MFLCLSWWSTSGAAEHPAASAVLAEVGKSKITVGEFEPIMLSEGAAGDPEATKEILFSSIRMEALAQEAVRRGFAKHEVASNEEIQRLITSALGEHPDPERYKQFTREIFRRTHVEVHDDVLQALIKASGPEKHRFRQNVEAKMNLALLRIHISKWHDSHATGPQWRYPPSTDWSPAKPCCKYPSKHCPADVEGHEQIFSAPAWRAFDFVMLDPFLFQYRFVSSGVGKSAQFRVEARADLDCKGASSGFFVEGKEGSSGLEMSPIQAIK